MKKTYDCGIDLGTTNSCIARPNADNTCDVIDSSEGGNVTPSVVRIDKAGHITVGAFAKKASNPEDVKKEFKRGMGTNTTYLFESSGIEKTPIELSAEVLKQLKMDYESSYYDEPLMNVVITVPAAFGLVQCEATKKAGLAAGFKNIILLQEPIAAAIAYGAKPGTQEEYWLVFDYGGGTLDVSVISTKDGYLDNINSRGNNLMGGKDLDGILYEKIILPKMQKQFSLPNGLNPIAKNLIMEDVEACKKKLSVKQSVTFFPDNARNIYDDDKNLIEFECTITRQEFEEAIIDEIKKAVAIARASLTESGISENQIDRILLVGGSTKVPLVREELKKEFSIRLDGSINPMTVVAEGAALFAASQVVEDEVPEISNDDDAGYLLQYEYKNMTAQTDEMIVGTIKNSRNDIKRVKIDCVADENATAALWSSGWCNVASIDKTTVSFDISVKICNINSPNRYIISATDSRGSKVKLNGYIFEILHNESVLQVLAPPLPHDVGVLANDGSRNKIEWFIDKNTKLPIKRMLNTLVLDKTLDPSIKDKCVFEFYEGERENEYNPHACQLVGRIIVESRELKKKVNKGTEVEILLEIDISRNAKVSASLPDHSIELFADRDLEALGGKANVLVLLTQVEEEMKKTKLSLNTLRQKRINIGDLYLRLNEIEAEYNRYLGLVGKDDDSVLRYVQKFYSLETEVVQQEMGTRVEVQERETATTLNRAEGNIIRYGSEEQKEQFKKLKHQRESFQDDNTRRYVEEQIDELETNVVVNSFEWLKMIYTGVYETGYHEFSDKQKADYWKGQARTAISKQDADGLKTAIIALQNLRLSGVSEEINRDLAHLRIR